MKNFLIATLSVYFVCSFNYSLAQNTGEYRSTKSGNWKASDSWQMYNGTLWMPAAVAPTNASNKITIRAGHSITITDSVFADEITINAGGDLNITNPGTNAQFFLMNGPGTDLLCLGRLTIDNNAVIADDTLNAGAAIEYKSDTLFQSGGVGPAITFNGSMPQVISGSGYMGSIVVNNPSNLGITGTTSFTHVQFVTGKINVTGGGLLVATEYGTGFSGQNDQSFIDGSVVYIIYDSSLHSFSAPVGKGIKYLPVVLTIKQDSLVQTNFVINLHDGAPPMRDLPPTIGKVSEVRYYTISRSASIAQIQQASLQLSYIADDNVSDPSKLRIVKSEGTGWKDIGGVGSGTPSGIITSTENFTTFSDFALANTTDGQNTLPLNIVALTAAIRSNAIDVHWKAVNEASTLLYELQCKDPDNKWQTIASIPVNIFGNYLYIDKSRRQAGKVIYRLKQVNKDALIFYSNEVQVNFSNTVKELVLSALFPNPAEHQLMLTASDEMSAPLRIGIVNDNGQVISKHNGITNQSLTIPLNRLKSGHYIITVTNTITGDQVSKSFIKK